MMMKYKIDKIRPTGFNWSFVNEIGYCTLFTGIQEM